MPCRHPQCEQLSTNVRETARARPARGEGRLIHGYQFGNRTTIGAVARPLQDASGRVPGRLFIANDIAPRAAGGISGIEDDAEVEHGQ